MASLKQSAAHAARILSRDQAQSVAEYALILVGVAVAVMAGVIALGVGIDASWGEIAEAFTP